MSFPEFINVPEICVTNLKSPALNKLVLFNVLIFVPLTNAACLLLKVVQFAAVNKPRFAALAEGKLKV